MENLATVVESMIKEVQNHQGITSMDLFHSAKIIKAMDNEDDFFLSSPHYGWEGRKEWLEVKMEALENTTVNYMCMQLDDYTRVPLPLFLYSRDSDFPLQAKLIAVVSQWGPMQEFLSEIKEEIHKKAKSIVAQLQERGLSSAYIVGEAITELDYFDDYSLVPTIFRVSVTGDVELFEVNHNQHYLFDASAINKFAEEDLQELLVDLEAAERKLKALKKHPKQGSEHSG